MNKKNSFIFYAPSWMKEPKYRETLKRYRDSAGCRVFFNTPIPEYRALGKAWDALIQAIMDELKPVMDDLVKILRWLERRTP